MAAELQSAPKQAVIARLKSALGRLGNMRAEAERVAQRGMLIGSAVLGGGAAGWVEGKAVAKQWDLTLGENGPSKVTVAGAVVAGLGALAGSFLGETAANAATGIGAGVLAYKAGDHMRRSAESAA